MFEITNDSTLQKRYVGFENLPVVLRNLNDSIKIIPNDQTILALLDFGDLGDPGE